MAHHIEDRDTMFSVKKAPWHGLGTILDAAPTVEEAIRIAYLAWEVYADPLFTKDGTAVEACAIRRKDTNEVLGDHVGSDWKPLQNKDAFAWFQPFVDSGLVTLETGGSLFNGKRIWILAKIAGQETLDITGAGDIVERYILLANSHDGSLAIRAGYTPVRVVCHNTLSAAIGKDPTTGKDTDKGLAIVKICHTKGSHARLADVGQAIAEADRHFERTADVFRQLARRSITGTQFREYIRKTLEIKPPPGKTEISGRAVVTLEQLVANFDENRQITRELFERHQQTQQIATQAHEIVGAALLDDILTGNLEAGRGQAETQGARGPTWWHAYNAVTEYLTHQRGRNAETRLDQQWFGAGAQLNKAALANAMQGSAV